ncbi:MAG: hypothetical protein L6Q33_08130 [Bacteriovoracaceae bacterium]|nr:hypothetical protein [Bacteriovoracaceae bacterium]
MSTRKEISNLIIKRQNLSPYWSEVFLSEEQALFEKLGLTYLSPHAPKDAEFDILITNTHTDFSSLSNQQINRLKLVLHPNSGYDNFTMPFVKDLDAPIILGNSLRANAVSEVILAELFARFSLSRHHQEWDKERKWPRKLLSDQKILIVGMGMIGNTLYQSLLPLVTDLMLYDPFKGYNDLPKENRDNNGLVDVILLAASLNPISKNMINSLFLRHLADDGTIINCARGELIDQQALFDFLDNNPSAFAYTDVFAQEPEDFEAIKRDNLKTTSHIAGVHSALELKTRDFLEKVTTNFLSMPNEEFKNLYAPIILQNRIHDHFLI